MRAWGSGRASGAEPRAVESPAEGEAGSSRPPGQNTAPWGWCSRPEGLLEDSRGHGQGVRSRVPDQCSQAGGGEAGMRTRESWKVKIEFA